MRGSTRGGMMAALAVVLLLGAASAGAQVTVTTSGDAIPGATITATVATTDGSTIQSVTWSQVAGPDATLSSTSGTSIQVQLPTEDAFKAYLFHVLAEPPITAEQLPPNVPIPAHDFAGGIQDRWQVVATNPFALEHAGLVKLQATVVTSAGTQIGTASIHTMLPWAWTTGITNVPVDVPVLLYGKEQASYSWTLTPPTGSTTTLLDAGTRFPEFTPDKVGTYTVTVTDLASGQPVTLAIYAGTWTGVIVGETPDGHPEVDQACLNCHNGNQAPNVFEEWKLTGHAEIFKDNLNTSTHYGPNCFPCHTVGYDPVATNNGVDDQDDYQAFLDSGLINNPSADNYATVLEQFPHTARMSNIQCENCHGPQFSPAHTLTDARVSLSSDVCASCHGEPLRHGRFQQWQLSAHANYETAISTGTRNGCANCHSGNGFVEWVEAHGADPDASVQVTWDAATVHPQTCATCHDPHGIGTTSGNDDTNATVRISGSTPELMAGFTAHDVGRGAVCMTCHNGRRGQRNDQTFASFSDRARAPHVGPQTDVLMGENMYFIATGNRSYHSFVEDSCVSCHMETTPPPADLSYNEGGTNHTFFASADICQNCHSVITAESVRNVVEHKLEVLHEEIVEAYHRAFALYTSAGRVVQLGSVATITDITDVADIEFEESHGNQAIDVYFTDGTAAEHVTLNNVKVVFPSGTATPILDLQPNLAKAGWNYFMVHSDGSEGVHNPTFVNSALDVTLFAITTVAADEGGSGGGGDVGPGAGDGAGAVACTSPYVYWAEIAAHNEGEAGSVWRTDLVAHNLADEMAQVGFFLHSSSGQVAGTGTVDAGAQGVFEDIVASLGVTGKGALEVCSDQPLEVVARIFNLADGKTFGQFIDGHVGGRGLAAGQSARLLALRQSAAFRTNLSVTNGGSAPAVVSVSLYSTDGEQLAAYELNVPAGMVVQDLEPFKARANRPDLGWGFAVVEVASGSQVLASASVIDMGTNDATTIPMKR